MLNLTRSRSNFFPKIVITLSVKVTLVKLNPLCLSLDLDPDRSRLIDLDLDQ